MPKCVAVPADELPKRVVGCLPLARRLRLGPCILCRACFMPTRLRADSVFLLLPRVNLSEWLGSMRLTQVKDKQRPPRLTPYGSRLTVHGSRLPNRPARGSSERGLTLIEIMVTVAIIAAIVGISYPTFTRGLDGIRLRTSVSRAGTFFHRARQQADRRQRTVQFLVDPEKQMLSAAAIEGPWRDEFRFEDGIQVVFPTERATLILYPGQPAPEFRLRLANRAGARAGLKVNVFTGVPEKWEGEK